MRVLIENTGNGDGMESKFKVYKGYNPINKQFHPEYVCTVEEDDFFELFANPEKEAEKAANGKIYFDVKLSDLENIEVKLNWFNKSWDRVKS